MNWNRGNNLVKYFLALCQLGIETLFFRTWMHYIDRCGV